MTKIHLGQILEYTNIYVPVYIEDEFHRYEAISGKPQELLRMLQNQLFCPVDYIRNVDGGHYGDDEKSAHGIVIGIGLGTFEEYFKEYL